VNLLAGRSAKARIPWGLLGMLCLVGAGERALASRALDIDTVVALDWKETLRAATRQARASDLLCLGDSQIKVGVASRVVEAGSGLRTYNLALLGGQTPASYFLLKRALQRGARPRAIVVEFMPTLLARGRDQNARLWPGLLGCADCIELAWIARDARFCAATLLARVLPSLGLRLEIRAFVLGTLLGQNASRWEENTYHKRHWRLNQGAQVLAEWPNREDPAAWYQINFKEPWTCERANRVYLEKLLRLAQKRGINVFWFLAPLNPVAQALLERGDQEQRFLRLLHSVQRQFPNVTVLDARHSGYEPAVFCDTVHLNRQGAAVLSSDLGSLLARLLAEPAQLPRWVQVPRYVARDVQPPLEDLAQSRIAQQAIEGVRQR